MKWWASMFMGVALVGGLIGFSDVAVATAQLGRAVFAAFTTLFLICLVLALRQQRQNQSPRWTCRRGPRPRQGRIHRAEPRPHAGDLS